MSTFACHALVLSTVCALFASGCAAATTDADESADATGAAVTAGAVTELRSTGTTASTGLTVTSSIEREGAGRAEYLTVRRGDTSVKLACSSVVTVDKDGTGLIASDCAYEAQPGFQPGVNECRITVNIALPKNQLKPTPVTCRSPGKLSTEQKAFLGLVFGSKTYDVVPDRTYSSSTGEVGGSLEVPLKLASLGTDIEKDSYALMAHVGGAARALHGKTPTQSYGKPLETPASEPTWRVSVYLEDLPKNTLSLNVLAGRALSVSRGIDALGANGTIASQADLSARFAASVGAE